MLENFYYNDWLCDWCDGTFIPMNIQHRYCCRKCSNAAANARLKARKEATASEQTNGER